MSGEEPRESGGQGLASTVVRVLKGLAARGRGVLADLGRVKRPAYGRWWQHAGRDFYERIHEARPALHSSFVDYVEGLDGVRSVLEIGCGTGIYPTRHRSLFEGAEYTGVDISESAIAECRKSSDCEFICGDFIALDMNGRTFDLVFSHAVIDHVYDIDGFLTAIVNVCGRYAFVSAYLGWLPELTEHRMEWSSSWACYHNQLSVQQLAGALRASGLSDGEFRIRPQDVLLNGSEHVETIIEIERDLTE